VLNRRHIADTGAMFDLIFFGIILIAIALSALFAWQSLHR
jgi:hypothetical protein